MSLFHLKSRLKGTFLAATLATLVPQALFAECTTMGDQDSWYIVVCTGGEFVCTTVWYGDTLTHSQCKPA